MCLAREKFFEEDGGITEDGFGFALRLFKARGELGFIMNHAHAAAAAAHSGFDNDGIADFRSDLAGLGGRGDGLFRTGENGNAGGLCEAARRGFVAEEFEKFRSWADEGEAGFGARAGEGRVFREEAVAGMDGVDFVGFGDGDDPRDVEVGCDGTFAGADLVGFVGFEAVECEAVFVGVDGDGAEAQFVGGAEDANGDFAAVGGEKFADGRRFFHDRKFYIFSWMGG